MEVIKLIYEGKDVEFQLGNNEVMVNATLLGEMFNKNPYDFYHTKSVQKFIKAFCRYDNCRFGDEFSPAGKLIKVVRGDQSVQGTWMRREVALKFAAWLSPDLEVWIFKTIDKILYQYFTIMQEIADEKKEIKTKFDENFKILSQYPYYIENQRLIELDKQADKKAKTALKKILKKQDLEINLEYEIKK